MEVFSPSQAIKTLKDNYIAIEQLGAEIEVKAISHLKATAELMDAETEAREKYFLEKPCKGFELPHWLKLQTAAATFNEAYTKQELRILKDKLEIVIEVNNSLKAAIRLAENEMQNLNFRQ